MCRTIVMMMIGHIITEACASVYHHVVKAHRHCTATLGNGSLLSVPLAKAWKACLEHGKPV